jgi:CubicO group peptidase (beta-lactamase class C family)
MQEIEEKFHVATQGSSRIIAGAVIGTSNGESSWTKPFGRVSIEEGATDMKDDSVMWVASCTKLMTTIAAIQCVEKELFTLDEDVSRILPE